MLIIILSLIQRKYDDLDCVFWINFFSIEIPMSKTLNKDGTPRKIGSGKTKGAGCYAQVTLAELQEVLSNDAKIQVSRVWLKNIGLIEGNAQKKLPSKAQVKSSSAKTKDLPTPKIIRINSKKEDTGQSSERQNTESYEPPPLFATGEINLDQY